MFNRANYSRLGKKSRYFFLCASILRNLLAKVAPLGLIFKKNSYLRSTGWVESIKRGYPCDQDGEAVPWMNYPTISILKERLNKNLNLFEFGSGYSTLFYARLVKSVVSIEYNRGWFYFMKSKVPDNVSLIYKNKDINGSYCRSVTKYNKEYDIVIIDGRDRVNCLKQSINRLSNAGVIILDDSERNCYVEGIHYCKERGFRALHLTGLKSTTAESYRTTILYRKDNCLNI